MTSRQAAIAGLLVATIGLLYVPLLLFGVYCVPGVFAFTGVIEGGLEKSFVIVTATGGLVGFALAALVDAAAPPVDRIRARRAKIVGSLALAGAAFWWFIIVIGGALAIQ